jgi:hypothetical protein
MERASIRRVLLLTALAIFVGSNSFNFTVFPPKAIVLARETGQRWSIDLVPYGFHLGESGSETDYVSDTRVAASENVVALAMQKLSPTSRIKKPRRYLQARWDVFLFLFDVKTGSLRAKSGPWTGGLAFEIFSTSQGSFLLHLWDYPSPHAGEKPVEALLLISPSGEQVKELDLAAVSDPELSHRDWTVSISPSRKTLLLAEPRVDGRHYEIVDANTLSKRSEWTDAGRKNPAAFAVSDNELLGASQSVTQGGSTEGNGKYEFLVRTLDGPWKPFRTSNYTWQFLSDDMVAGFEELREASGAGTNGYRLVVSRIDGTNVLSHSIQESHHEFSRSDPFVTSTDGRHLASLINWQSTTELWRDLDMAPAGSHLYVWALPNPEPVIKAKVSDGFSHYSFSPEGDWIYVAGLHTVKAIRVPGK